MFDKHRLSACLAFSVLLHGLIGGLGDYRVVQAPGGGEVIRKHALNVFFLPMAVKQSGVAGSDGLLQNAPSASSVARGSSAVPDEQATGIRGDEVQAPVMALSVDDYLPPSRLDRIPKALSSVDTRIDMRGLFGVVGEAEIMLLISSDGGVDGVLVLEASLPDFIVEEAVKRFRNVVFEPGRIGERPVRSRLRIRFSPPSQDELLGNPHSAREKAWR